MTKVTFEVIIVSHCLASERLLFVILMGKCFCLADGYRGTRDNRQALLANADCPEDTHNVAKNNAVTTLHFIRQSFFFFNY